MRILSIGNSFSQDAQRYLHELALSEGVRLDTANLYIGGCTLERHYINMLEDNCHYDLQFNGQSTGIKLSIRQALVAGWDVVTLQQASPKSFIPDSYTPYIEELAEYVRTYLPKAKIYIHSTWAYEDGSERLLNLMGEGSCAADMQRLAEAAYINAAALVSADGIIPSGAAMLGALRLGAERVHRDCFHASLGLGRYILALTWYKALTGGEIDGNGFDALDEPITDREREIAIEAVNAAFCK